ncbi:MAG TPA: nuclear transport factor 2 family protein [Solirubrobacterales bacterium]|nr:nuclear transport factor 2 family protein [Solirubrobacterales bacterium]
MSPVPDAEPTPIERLFVALIEGQPDEVVTLLHPQVEWSPTVWSGEGTYRGVAGVRRWLDQFGERLRHLDIRVEKVREEGDLGVVLGTVFDSREDTMFAVRLAWSFELEDGLVRRGRAHESWEEALRTAGMG